MPAVAFTRKETIATRLVSRIRADILRGTLPPGFKINLDRLRESHDVSLAPVREAMSRLAADGLVRVEEQRGYSVAPMSAADLAEVTLLRSTMEPLALGHAIDKGDIDWEGGVLAALHRLGRTPHSSAPPEGDDLWETSHTAFHTALIQGCAMPLLVGFCTRLLGLNERYRRLCRAPAESSLVAQEHQAIANAAVARDRARACSLLTDHIARTGQRLRAGFADQFAEPTTP